MIGTGTMILANGLIANQMIEKAKKDREVKPVAYNEDLYLHRKRKPSVADAIEAINSSWEGTAIWTGTEKNLLIEFRPKSYYLFSVN